MACVARLARGDQPPLQGIRARHSRPRHLAAILAFALAALLSVGIAEAASFGTGTSALHAGNKMIASCGQGMEFAYTTSFDNGIPGYAVNGINLSNIPASCLSKKFSATFYNGSNNAVGSAISSTLPASGTTQSISITPSSNTIDASLVTGVSVVVS